MMKFLALTLYLLARTILAKLITKILQKIEQYCVIYFEFLYFQQKINKSVDEFEQLNSD